MGDTSEGSAAAGIVIIIVIVAALIGTIISVNQGKSDTSTQKTASTSKVSYTNETKPKCPDENPCVVREVKYATVDYGVAYINDNNLEVGKQALHSEGKFGKAEYIYDVTYQDNKEISSTLVSSGIIVEPVPVVYGVGTKVVWHCRDVTSYDRNPYNDNLCCNSYGQCRYCSDSEAERLDPYYRSGKSGHPWYNSF